MSSYVYKKALRYKLSEDDLNYLQNIAKDYLANHSYWSIYDYLGFEVLDKVNADVPPWQKTYKFDIDCGHNYTQSTSEQYLDYVLDYSYGERCDAFSRARYTTENEQSRYKELFEQIIPTVDISRVHLVEFCYYNGCEPNDCYDPMEDDFYKEV